MLSSTAWLSMAGGNGSCTRMPSTSSSSLSERTSSTSSAWLVPSRREKTCEETPARCANRSLARTYEALAGSSPTRMKVRRGTYGSSATSAFRRSISSAATLFPSRTTAAVSGPIGRRSRTTQRPQHLSQHPVHEPARLVAAELLRQSHGHLDGHLRRVVAVHHLRDRQAQDVQIGLRHLPEGPTRDRLLQQRVDPLAVGGVVLHQTVGERHGRRVQRLAVRARLGVLVILLGQFLPHVGPHFQQRLPTAVGLEEGAESQLARAPSTHSAAPRRPAPRPPPPRSRWAPGAPSWR